MEKNVLDILERPFDASQIKQRQGSFGKMLDYISGTDVIARLQEAFNGDYSFSVLEWKVLEDEIVVLGELTAGGLSKSAFGNKKIARNTKDDSIISIGDDIKAAATDSLKVCAKLFGVALHLYSDKETVKEEKKAEPKSNGGNGSNNGNGSNGGSTSALITLAQTNACLAIARKINMSNAGLSKLIKSEVGGTRLESLTKKQASDLIQRLQAMTQQAA